MSTDNKTNSQVDNQQNQQQAQQSALQPELSPLQQQLLAKINQTNLAEVEAQHRKLVRSKLESYRKKLEEQQFLEINSEAATAEIAKAEQAVEEDLEVINEDNSGTQDKLLIADRKHKQMLQAKIPTTWVIVVVFALVSMIMPFSIDMYLSSFGIMAEQLADGDNAKIEFTLSIFFIGIACGQLLWGPIADSWGRKKITLFALVMVVLSCFIITQVNSLEVLYLMRFVQGFFLASILVTSTAMLRDIYETNDFVRINGLITLLFFVAPFVAPFVGSWIAPIFGWHAIFAVIAAMAVLGFFLILIFIPETINPMFKRKLEFGNTLRTMGQIMIDGRSLSLILLLSFTSTIIFLYVSISSSVLQNYYGVTPELFPYFFMINIIGQSIYNWLNTRYVKKLGPQKLLKLGMLSMLVGMISCIVVVCFDLGLVGIVTAVLLCMSSCTFIFLNAIALYLEIQYRHAGTAGSLVNICRWIMPGVVTALVQQLDPWRGYTMISMIGLFAGLVILTYFVYKYYLTKKATPAN